MDNKQSISNIERQNVLNNRFAIEAIQKALDIEAMFFDGQYCFTKQMVADFYEVEDVNFVSSAKYVTRPSL